jgi:hypothetical protein
LTSADWQIQGTDKAPLAGQVICYTATVTGNGSAGIDFNPATRRDHPPRG